MLTVSVAASSTLLTTLAAVKSELAITATTDDTHLTSLISPASLALAKACGRDHFGRETVVQTERLSTYRLCIILDRDIDVTISSVVVDGVTLDTDEYEVDGSLLYRLTDDARECWAPGKVVITYAAGYTLPAGAPSDLARACILLIGSAYAGRGRDPALRSERILDVIDTSYFDPNKAATASGLPADVDMLIQPYMVFSV